MVELHYFINSGYTQTWYKTANLCMNWTLFQVVDDCVGNPGQMSHVPSSHATGWPVHRSQTLREALILQLLVKKKKKKNSIENYLGIKLLYLIILFPSI